MVSFVISKYVSAEDIIHRFRKRIRFKNLSVQIIISNYQYDDTP